jgi:hypothetical protein
MHGSFWFLSRSCSCCQWGTLKTLACLDERDTLGTRDTLLKYEEYCTEYTLLGYVLGVQHDLPFPSLDTAKERQSIDKLGVLIDMYYLEVIGTS